MKQIQINYELFCSLCDFFFDDETAPQGIEADNIRNQLNEKIDKIISRELFTKYKRAISPSEREAYRQEYLNHRGILKAFRTEKECHKNNL